MGIKMGVAPAPKSAQRRKEKQTGHEGHADSPYRQSETTPLTAA